MIGICLQKCPFVSQLCDLHCQGTSGNKDRKRRDENRASLQISRDAAREQFVGSSPLKVSQNPGAQSNIADGRSTSRYDRESGWRWLSLK